ncbi:hypothetical protein NECAME_06537 [Necator americanus]|uniref:SCP domain-containing protein n=1 Tax=Necator americanus TaxID=51031 RepID=W2TTN2_NECAM|nr:hypothetical protein NECAME_06537 [Necator americanus]ETN85148.1 hypothetical protein NECAME_06537 [Necator americanus]
MSVSTNLFCSILILVIMTTLGKNKQGTTDCHIYLNHSMYREERESLLTEVRKVKKEMNYECDLERLACQNWDHRYSGYLRVIGGAFPLQHRVTMQSDNQRDYFFEKASNKWSGRRLGSVDKSSPFLS